MYHYGTYSPYHIVTKKPQKIWGFKGYSVKHCSNEKLFYGINTALKFAGFSMSATYSTGGITVFPEP